MFSRFIRVSFMVIILMYVVYHMVGAKSNDEQLYYVQDWHQSYSDLVLYQDGISTIIAKTDKFNDSEGLACWNNELYLGVNKEPNDEVSLYKYQLTTNGLNSLVKVSDFLTKVADYNLQELDSLVVVDNKLYGWVERGGVTGLVELRTDGSYNLIYPSTKIISGMVYNSANQLLYLGGNNKVFTFDFKTKVFTKLYTLAEHTDIDALTFIDDNLYFSLSGIDHLFYIDNFSVVHETNIVLSHDTDDMTFCDLNNETNVTPIPIVTETNEATPIVDITPTAIATPEATSISPKDKEIITTTVNFTDVTKIEVSYPTALEITKEPKPDIPENLYIYFYADVNNNNHKENDEQLICCYDVNIEQYPIGNEQLSSILYYNISEKYVKLNLDNHYLVSVSMFNVEVEFDFTNPDEHYVIAVPVKAVNIPVIKR